MPEWKPMTDVPRDGTPIQVRSVSTFRWMPYKRPNAGKEKYMEEIDGKLGRWQVMNEMGTWVNTQEPVGDWHD